MKYPSHCRAKITRVTSWTLDQIQGTTANIVRIFHAVLAQPIRIHGSRKRKKLSKLELSSEEKNQRIKILETELDSVQQAPDIFYTL